MTTIFDSEEESIPLPAPQPRRFAKNPRREGYERDSSYVGTTDDDVARLEAEREAPAPPNFRLAGMSPANTAKFFQAVDMLFFREDQLSAEDLARPEISLILDAAHKIIEAVMLKNY